MPNKPYAQKVRDEYQPGSKVAWMARLMRCHGMEHKEDTS